MLLTTLVTTTESKYSKTIEDVLAILDTALEPINLTHTQQLVVRQVWEGKTYAQIAEQNGYSNDYIKSVGSELWQSLSQVLGKPVTKRNFRVVIQRQLAKLKDPSITKDDFLVSNPKTQDWGEAIDTSFFFGRIQELASLKKWIVSDKCRLVSVLGMGGVGKTSLAVSCAEQIQGEFNYLIWRSLLHAPSIDTLLTDLLQFLAQGKDTDLPEDTNGKISHLMTYLRQHRCLLVLDNYESILCSSQEEEDDEQWASRSWNTSLSVGCYRRGYEGYNQLLKRIGEERHQSCLLLTSREKPMGLAAKEGDSLPIRSLKLKALGTQETQVIFKTAGIRISESAAGQLVYRYSGNPQVLKIAATVIREVFDRDVRAFLAQDTLIFGEIAALLDQQFERLSSVERQVIQRLAVYREGVPLEQLQQDLYKSVNSHQLVAALKGLQWRSLVESSASQFRLPPLILKYVARLPGQ
ncbi:MAG TPA: hypothetical protein DD379_15975 [Cyanobacteria bacterium UBA11162]|nr:hypothetical protein [Cyanobacteria bacterium UBA11162]